MKNTREQKPQGISETYARSSIPGKS
jgi:hypothetical protein